MLQVNGSLGLETQFSQNPYGSHHDGMVPRRFQLCCELCGFRQVISTLWVQGPLHKLYPPGTTSTANWDHSHSPPGTTSTATWDHSHSPPCPTPPTTGALNNPLDCWASLRELSLPHPCAQDAKHPSGDSATFPSSDQPCLGSRKSYQRAGVLGLAGLMGVPRGSVPPAPGLQATPQALPTPGRLRGKALPGAIFAATQRLPRAARLGPPATQDHPAPGWETVGASQGLPWPGPCTLEAVSEDTWGQGGGRSDQLWAEQDTTLPQLWLCCGRGGAPPPPSSGKRRQAPCCPRCALSRSCSVCCPWSTRLHSTVALSASHTLTRDRHIHAVTHTAPDRAAGSWRQGPSCPSLWVTPGPQS